MSTFEDANRREWTIELDGILLDAVRQETGIDLADLSAGGLARIEQDAVSLVKVLAVVCRDEIKEANKRVRQFAQVIKGDVLTSAFEAIVKSAENFFPPKTWSEVQSRLSQQREFNQQWTKLRPMLVKLNDPEMPSALREAVMAALSEMMGSIDSQSLEEVVSAGGQATIPSTPVTDSPENPESAPAA